MVEESCRSYVQVKLIVSARALARAKKAKTHAFLLESISYVLLYALAHSAHLIPLFPFPCLLRQLHEYLMSV